MGNLSVEPISRYKDYLSFEDNKVCYLCGGCLEGGIKRRCYLVGDDLSFDGKDFVEEPPVNPLHDDPSLHQSTVVCVFQRRLGSGTGGQCGGGGRSSSSTLPGPTSFDDPIVRIDICPETWQITALVIRIRLTTLSSHVTLQKATCVVSVLLSSTVTSSCSSGQLTTRCFRRQGHPISARVLRKTLSEPLRKVGTS